MKYVNLSSWSQLFEDEGKYYLRRKNEYTGGISVIEGKEKNDKIEFDSFQLSKSAIKIYFAD